MEKKEFLAKALENLYLSIDESKLLGFSGTKKNINTKISKTSTF